MLSVYTDLKHNIYGKNRHFFLKYSRININYKGIIAGFFLMFAASILFFYYDRIHMMHLCPDWLKKNTHYVHGNAAQSLVNNER